MGLNKQFLHYAVVGLAGTTAQYLMLVSLVYGLSANAVIASSAGYILGAFVNYYLNFRFTFSSNKKHSDALPKFLVVAGVGFGLNGLLMFVFVEYFFLHYFVSQVLATGIILFWTFGANKIWTFREKQVDKR